MMKTPKRNGFTLIELMIVVAVVAVLAAIALPSYSYAVRKSRRADAQAVLSEMAIKQEKWRANNAAYSSTATQVGAPSTGKILSYYSFAISHDDPLPSNTASKYSVKATPVAGTDQVNDKQNGVTCGTLSINQSGERKPPECW